MKKLTITVDDDVYKGLRSRVGVRRISRFLNNMARPLVVDDAVEAAYREQALAEKNNPALAADIAAWLALAGETLPAGDDWQAWMANGHAR